MIMANPGLSIIPKVSKITPRILRILGCNPGPMTLQGTNTYIVGKGKRYVTLLFKTTFTTGLYYSSKMQVGSCYYCNIYFRRLLIDTGDGQQAEFFLNLKKSINFDKFAITDVILTHWHHDHIGGVGTCSASVGGVMKSAEVS